MVNIKVAVVGLRKDYFEKEVEKEKDLILVKSNPDVVIAFGGDGTFLYSEIEYPGVPKVLVKHSSKCKKCESHDYKKIIKALVNKSFKVVEFIKLQASINGNKLVALNDVNVHYHPPCAIRLDVEVNNEKIAQEVIGDGVIVSTPYGSSGYFSSIARKTFNKGIGIAFNNTVNVMKHPIYPENSVIKIKIVRGPGILCVDCNDKIIPLKTGDVIKIQKHSHFARILELDGERKVKI